MLKYKRTCIICNKKYMTGYPPIHEGSLHPYVCSICRKQRGENACYEAANTWLHNLTEEKRLIIKEESYSI